MAFAHAMLKAGGDDRASIQEGMQSFKVSNLGTDATTVVVLVRMGSAQQKRCTMLVVQSVLKELQDGLSSMILVTV